MTRIEEVRHIVHERIAGRARFYDKVAVMKGSVAKKAAPSVITGGIDDSDSGLKGAVSSSSKSIEKKTNDYGDFYTVTLDGNELKSPRRHELYFPTMELACGVAVEWERQGGDKMVVEDESVDDDNTNYNPKTIEPSTMPLMTLCSTAVDQIGVTPETEETFGGRAKVEENVMKYLFNDTTCYFADDTEDDRLLLAKQKDSFNNLHAFAEKELNGKVDVVHGFDLRKIKHGEELVQNACLFVAGLSGWELAALQSVTMEAKSFLVGLGVIKGFLSGEEAIKLSRIEEEFQLETWGLVEGGQDIDRLNCGVQIYASCVYLDMLRAK